MPAIHNQPLPKPQRTQLENTVKAAREVAEKVPAPRWPSWPWVKAARPTT